MQEEEEAAAVMTRYDFTGNSTPSLLFEIPQYAVRVPILEGPNVVALVDAAKQVNKDWQKLFKP